MQDLLRITDATGTREVMLPRGLVTFGLDEQSTFRVQHCGSPLRPMRWEPRRACWQLLSDSTENGELAINGQPVEGSKTIMLNHLDYLEMGDVQMRFERVLDDPIRHSQPMREIALGGDRIIFGGGKEPSGEPGLVRLDAEDPSISRVHACILPDGDDYRLEDHSATGTELNGAAFHQERLIFGDRFRISGYIFEFTGNAVRYLQPELMGSVIARELTVLRGTQYILENVSLNVAAGEFIGILGRSGQGKTTLLNALCGIRPATRGRVILGGVLFTNRERRHAVTVGYVPQDDIVHIELTVWHAIYYSACLRVNLPARQTAALTERAINQLGLGEHRHKRVEQLSGGQRKRVSIAIELLARPSILFLDEPSSGLDPSMEAELMTLLQSLALTKLTVICTTHVLHKAYLFNRMLVIEGGHLIFAGASDEARLHFLATENQESSTVKNVPLEQIYTKLLEAERQSGSSPAQWEEAFQKSVFSNRAMVPLSERQAARLPDSAARRAGAWPTLRTLLARQWSILRADQLNLLFLLAQPVLIGLLLGWVASTSAQRLFLCIVATMWFGCSNGAQQIVAELAIFRREHLCGQSLHAYLGSKIGFLSAVSLVQAMLLLLMALLAAQVSRTGKTETGLAADFAKRLTPISVEDPFAGGDHFEVVGGDEPAAGHQATLAVAKISVQPVDPHSWRVRGLVIFSEFFEVSRNVLDSGPRLLKRSDGNPVKDARGREIIEPGLPVAQVLWVTVGLRVLTLAAAAVTSVGIGLAISALVNSTTQAVLWVPLVLIPQILLGGILVPVPEMSRSVRLLSQMMPSFSAQRIMDSAALFGLETPAMSNRTKTPLFLSSTGEKETIEWTEGGESRTQEYDRLSNVNVSWQNLLTIPSRLGQHKWETAESGNSGFTYPDSVQRRRDTLLRKNTPVRDFSFVGTALAALAAWCAACYSTMAAGLLWQQSK